MPNEFKKKWNRNIFTDKTIPVEEFRKDLDDPVKARLPFDNASLRSHQPLPSEVTRELIGDKGLALLDGVTGAVGGADLLSKWSRNRQPLPSAVKHTPDIGARQIQNSVNLPFKLLSAALPAVAGAGAMRGLFNQPMKQMARQHPAGPVVDRHIRRWEPDYYHPDVPRSFETDAGMRARPRIKDQMNIRNSDEAMDLPVADDRGFLPENVEGVPLAEPRSGGYAYGTPPPATYGPNGINTDYISILRNMTRPDKLNSAVAGAGASLAAGAEDLRERIARALAGGEK